MGLAASQGRYLCLTARNSDLVYEGQQISQQRMALAKETQEVSNQYNEAMSNTVMKVLLPGQDSQQLTYDLLTSEEMNMRIVDLDGRVVIPGEYLKVTEKAGEGEETEDKVYRVSSTQEFISKHMSDIDSETASQLASYSLVEIMKYYQDNNPNSNLDISFVGMNTKDKDLIQQNTSGVSTDPYCLDPKYLQEMIASNQYIIQQAGPSQNEWNDFMWQGSSMITEEYDRTDDAAAEAKYESAMLELQRKDKLLELRLEQVQTEQGAVEKEMESVKDIIGKNIENGFKTFA